MRISLWSLLFLGLIQLLVADPASAQNVRTWVASTGNDTVGCGSILNPCRTLQFGVNQTNANGEVDVKDSAGYGSIVINNPITIINDSGTAGVLAASGGVGIDINLSSGGQVSIKGLTVEGAGVGSTGIRFQGTGNLLLDNVRITNFTNAGLLFEPSGSSNLYYETGTVSNIAGPGINIAPSTLGSTDVVQATLALASGVNTTGYQVTGDGLSSTASILVTIWGGTIFDNSTGLNISSSGAATNVMVHNVVAQGNTTGYQVTGSAATLALGNSVIAANATPTAVTSGGSLSSFKDNYLVNNKNAAATATSISKY